MKNLGLIMLNNKPKLSEKRRDDIITTEKIFIGFFEVYLLRNRKTIVNK